MAELKLFGSGGSIVADLTEEQAKAADLGVGKLFLAPIGKIEQSKMSGHACNGCKKEFDGPPKISPESGSEEPEQVSENLMLVERGQYQCGECGSVIGEYRVFEKKGGDAGLAVPSA
ncbi:MAG: hypothetical protein OXP12_08410 [Thaumarchaeota archaeon]|nr:hypothetical protein [Nitrososphaerota archaeon]MDE0267154.1 hypothetical protein [Nitrososphaerota archaeon]MDE0525856.1 hypothetical protein [Nitrososphaerota archaeon]